MSYVSKRKRNQKRLILTEKQDQRRQKILENLKELKVRMEKYEGERDALYWSNLRYVKNMVNRFNSHKWHYLKVHRKEQFNQMWQRYE